MKITNNTSAVLKEVSRLSSAGLKEAGTILKKAAKDIVVVKSGDLRDSISAEVSRDGVILGSPLRYAPKIEMDKPFLRPALLRSKAAIGKVFKAH